MTIFLIPTSALSSPPSAPPTGFHRLLLRQDPERRPPDYTITLDKKLLADGALDGKQMNIVASGKHRTSYHIARVLPPGKVVQFDLSSEIYSPS